MVNGHRVVNGHRPWPTPPEGIPELPAGTYVWRDPRRVTPGRLAELERADGISPPDDGRSRYRSRPQGTGQTREAVAAGKDRAAARRALYGALRDRGVPRGDAEKAAGISHSTGKDYERKWKAAT